MKLFSSGGRTWLAPWNGYLFAQVFLLGIAYLKLAPQMENFQFSTWLALILSAIGFFSGCCLAMGNAIQKRQTQIVDSMEFEEKFIRLLQCMLPILLLVFLVGVLTCYKSAGGWPMFMKDPESARAKFAWPGFTGVLLFQSIYCVALAGIGVRKKAKNWFWKILSWTAILMPILVGIISGMRFYSLLIGMSAILFMDIKKPIKLGRLVGFGIIILFILMGAFLARVGLLNRQALLFGLRHLEYAKKLYEPIYLYIANNFWNLDWLFKFHESTKEIPTTLGYSSFWGLFYPTHLTFSIDKAFNLDSQFQSVLKIQSLNTTTYQGVLFVDFGWAGIVIIPAILGFASTWAFQRARRAGGTFESLLHSVLGFSVFFSFFTWTCRQPSYAWGLIMILVIAGLAKGMTHHRVFLEPRQTIGGPTGSQIETSNLTSS